MSAPDSGINIKPEPPKTLTITASVAPEHANPYLVPRWATVPEWVQWMLGMIAALGGTFFGAAIIPTLGGGEGAVRALAKSCAAGNADSADACAQLAIQQSSPAWLIVAGGLLLLVAIGGYLLAHFTRKG